MEDVVDAILSDNEPKPVEVPVDKAQLTEAQAWLEKQIIDAQEQVEKQKAILEQLTSVFERCGGIKNKIAPAKPKAKPKETPATLNADKAKAVKTMTYQKKDEELGIESLSPARLVGAKAAILYNTKYRTLLRFVAKPGESLVVSGSSIRNHDEEKSTSKKVRKPKDFFAVNDRWKAYDLLKTTERKATTHVSAEMMIIETK
jgi:LysM repeat protein